MTTFREETPYRTYIPEPKAKKKRVWTDKPPEQREAVVANRCRTRGDRGKRLQRQRSERGERSSRMCARRAPRDGTVRTPGQNAKHYLAGSLHAQSGRLQWVAGPRKTGALFIALVDHLRTQAAYRGRRLHLVLENCRIHSSRAVAAAQLRWGRRVQLHFLPPYCPDHNRIERLWKDLHDNVTRNHRCGTMAELLLRVHDYLRQRQRGRHQYPQAA